MPVVALTTGQNTCNVEIPNTEYRILKAVVSLRQKEVTVRQIREWIATYDRKDGKKLSYASIYSLLRRLKKRNIIKVKAVLVNVLGTNYRRIIVDPSFETMTLIPSSKSAP